MSNPRDEILVAGVDDWVSLSQAESGVADAMPEAGREELRRATIATIERMMSEALLEVGELTPRFEPWTTSPAESIGILRTEWVVAGGRRDHGFDWWLRLTPTGKELARVLQNEGLDHSE